MKSIKLEPIMEKKDADDLIGSFLDKSFIDLRNCGNIGNTTLSRAASPGDSIIYLQVQADGIQVRMLLITERILDRYYFFLLHTLIIVYHGNIPD